MLNKHQQAGLDYANGRYDELTPQLKDYEATLEDAKKNMEQFREKLRKAFVGEMGPSGQTLSLLEEIRDTNKISKRLPQEAQAKLSTKMNSFQGAQKKMEDGLPHDLLELMYAILADHSGYSSVSAFVQDMEASSDSSMRSAMEAESLHSDPSDASMRSAMETSSVRTGISDASMRSAMDLGSVSSGRKPRRTPSRKPSRKSHAVPKQVSAKSDSADAVSVVTNNFDAMDIDTQLTGSSIKNGQAQAAIDNLTSGNQKPPASFVAPSSNLNPPSTPLGTSHQPTSTPVVSTPVVTGRAAPGLGTSNLTTPSRTPHFSSNTPKTPLVNTNLFSGPIPSGSRHAKGGGGAAYQADIVPDGNGGSASAGVFFGRPQGLLADGSILIKDTDDFDAFKAEYGSVCTAATASPGTQYSNASPAVCLTHAFHGTRINPQSLETVDYAKLKTMKVTSFRHMTTLLKNGGFNDNEAHKANFCLATRMEFVPMGSSSKISEAAWKTNYFNEFVARSFPGKYDQEALPEQHLWCAGELAAKKAAEKARQGGG